MSSRPSSSLPSTPPAPAGGDTFIHDVLQRAGFANVFAARFRYPAVAAADLRAAAPGVVLLSSEPYPFKGAHHAEVAEAVPGARVAGIDGELCSWYGSRLRRTPPYLARLAQALTEAA